MFTSWGYACHKKKVLVFLKIAWLQSQVFLILPTWLQTQGPYPRNKANANVSCKSVEECEYVNTGVSAHWRVCVWVCVLVSL